MRFSIIIPVYKAEKYLDKCLSSILQQDYDEYEILLINDGSPDGSGEICRSYAEKYGNVRYEYQENAGPSSARNRGIQMAAGEYLVFLDSDDEIASGSLKQLNEIILINTPDAIVSELIMHHLDSDTFEREPAVLDGTKLAAGREAALQELAVKRFYTPASRVVIKRRIVTDNHILFPMECAIGEDVFMMAQALCCCESFWHNPEPYYIYNQNPGSIMHNVNYERMRGTLDACARLYEAAASVSDDRKQFLYTQISRMIMIVFAEYASAFSSEQRKHTRMWMRQNKTMLRAIAHVHPATKLAGTVLGAENAFLFAGYVVARRNG